MSIINIKTRQRVLTKDEVRQALFDLWKERHERSKLDQAHWQQIEAKRQKLVEENPHLREYIATAEKKDKVLRQMQNAEYEKDHAARMGLSVEGYREMIRKIDALPKSATE